MRRAVPLCWSGVHADSNCAYFTVIKFSGLGPGQMLAHFPGRQQELFHLNGATGKQVLINVIWYKAQRAADVFLKFLPVISRVTGAF